MDGGGLEEQNVARFSDGGSGSLDSDQSTRERLLEVASAELGHSAQYPCDTLMAQADAYVGGGRRSTT